MTYEAELAKKNSYQLEAKKDGLKQVQSGDVKLTLTIQAADMPNALYSDPMGQRYMCVMVPINDDETPREKAKSYAGQAKMLAQDVDFQAYLSLNYSVAGHSETPEQAMKSILNIESCAELVEGSEPGRRFKQLQAEYLRWKDYNEYEV